MGESATLIGGLDGSGNVASFGAGSGKQLYQGAPGAVETLMYTVPAGGKSKVTQIIACNTTGGALTATLSIVPLSGTAGSTNRVLAAKSIPANDTLIVDIDQVMPAGSFLSGQASGAGVTFTISGSEAVT